jgi:hypothetical protein
VPKSLLQGLAFHQKLKRAKSHKDITSLARQIAREVIRQRKQEDVYRNVHLRYAPQSYSVFHPFWSTNCIVKGITLRFALLLSAVWIGSFVGCGRQDEITRYSITVPLGPSDVHPTAAEPVRNMAVDAAPIRMLAAIIPQGKETWFFKLTGPVEAVAKQQEPFTSLIKSVRFTDKTAQPSWDLPESWRQQGGSGMRFATIVIEEGERTLELTVIPLQTMGDLDEYVLGNVNRWRGQLGLTPVAALRPDDNDDASKSVRQFKLSDSTLVTLVNLVGQGSGSDAISAGFDMANHPPIPSQPLGAPAEPPDDDATITYTTPDGWSATEASGMRRAAFEVIDGKQKVEITVITLPQSGGERLANVNRWRNQIQMKDTTAQQLAKDLKKIPMASATGDFVELVGPAEATSRQAILAVLTDVEGSTWFFKLMGEADLAVRERERFLAFVQSVKFPLNVDGSNDE